MLLPESPRARRRLLLAAPVVVLVAGVAAVFLAIPSHGPSAPGPTGTEGPAQVASATPKTRLTAADRRAIDRTLDRFLPAAMERKDPAAGWALAGPEMRSGSTLADWRNGNSPVPFYEARETTFHDWQLIDSGPGYVIFNLLVHPAKTSKLAPYVFSGEVLKQHDRWLVNRLYTIAIMNRVTKTTHEIGPADFAAGATAGAQANPEKQSSSRIVPVLAILAVIALLPLSLGFVALRRARRWRRQVRSSERREIPALPARYRR
jgi:hypothetical protein